MVDRRSRRTILIKLSIQTQNAVIEALDNLEDSLGPEKFKKTFKTITVDNDSEFLNWKEMETSSFDKDENATESTSVMPIAPIREALMNKSTARYVVTFQKDPSSEITPKLKLKALRNGLTLILEEFTPVILP
ncbi:hypothetical protein CL176_01350 [Suicoccus acidiformans]|uniref:Uncharacterized protein n=1 Tax=Suicoccus acidiformans TaxID=2036206 RepID=A0A347WI61_9LACT|nr:hypothetical protein [Suicoccus acidiformans]AXY24768.1 hypothetical protein CL176_01350 [Suicoccus acidiformans]